MVKTKTKKTKTKVFDSFNDIMQNYDPSQNSTSKYMSKYEKCVVIGLRLEQLARGAAPNVNWNESMSVRDIALQELHEQKLPFVIKRTLPDGQFEYWRVKDLIVPL